MLPKSAKIMQIIIKFRFYIFSDGYSINRKY